MSRDHQKDDIKAAAQENRKTLHLVREQAKRDRRAHALFRKFGGGKEPTILTDED